MAFKCSLLALLALIASTLSANVEFNGNLADFSVDLHNKVANPKPNENVVVSPLSIQTSLGLLYMAAEGSTAEEISQALRLGTASKSTVGDNFKQMLDSYKNSPILKIANKIYSKDGYTIKPEFNQIATNQFNSEAQSIDFTNKNAAAQTINNWVEGKTNNLIKDLISPTTLDESTQLVLVNAIYFNAEWEKQFKTYDTLETDFFTSETDKIKVEMMTKGSLFKYGSFDDLKASVLEMNYKNSDLSMLFILPNEVNGLPALEEKLREKNLLDLSDSLQPVPVFVQVPKFKIESSIDLGDVLTKMGMKTMFSNSANFNNLFVSSAPLKVSKVIHKTFINVHEEGTEAAGSTAIEITPLMGSIMPDTKFIANRPFFFAIKSKSNILFSGRFVKRGV